MREAVNKSFYFKTAASFAYLHIRTFAHSSLTTRLQAHQPGEAF